MKPAPREEEPLNSSLPAPESLRPSLKGVFPFRLGTTSYIVPADLVPNVEFLAPQVDDIELILFESEEISNLPDAGVIERLAALQRGHSLSYTVHLPLDIQLGAADEAERRRSVAKCRRVLELTRPLDPFAWIVHFHGERRGADPVEDLVGWQAALDRSVGELLASGARPRDLCVETLEYPFALVEGIVARHGLSVCLDVGHLLLGGYPLESHFERYFARCRVLHFHGIEQGRDHCDLGWLDERVVRSVLVRLCSEPDRERVLTLELFDRGHFEKSLEVLEDYRQWRTSL